MRSKIRRSMIGMIFAFMLGLMVFFCITQKSEGVTVVADSERLSNPLFDYVYRSGTNLTIIQALTIKEDQVRNSKQLVIDKGESSEIYFEISNNGASASCDNTIFSQTIWISAVSQFDEHHFVVTDMQGKILMSSNDTKIKISLEKCKYLVTYTGTSTWDEELGSSTIHRKAQVDCSFYLYLSQDIATHDYRLTEFPPTCTTEGYSLHECLVCGNQYKDNVVPALTHQFVFSSIKPSCTSGGRNIATCELCGLIQNFSDGSLPMGHSFSSMIIKTASCTEMGQRHLICDQCAFEYYEEIQARGHSYTITEISKIGGNTRRIYTCSVCGEQYVQELGNQYDEIANFIEYLFSQYSPYMIWIFLATAGIWSLAIGIALIVAHRNEEKEKVKKMLFNYVVGIVVIFILIVACPYLVRGVAILIT